MVMDLGEWNNINIRYFIDSKYYTINLEVTVI